MKPSIIFSGTPTFGPLTSFASILISLGKSRTKSTKRVGVE